MVLAHLASFWDAGCYTSLAGCTMTGGVGSWIWGWLVLGVIRMLHPPWNVYNCKRCSKWHIASCFGIFIFCQAQVPVLVPLYPIPVQSKSSSFWFNHAASGAGSTKLVSDWSDSEKHQFSLVKSEPSTQRSIFIYDDRIKWLNDWMEIPCGKGRNQASHNIKQPVWGAKYSSLNIELIKIKAKSKY